MHSLFFECIIFLDLFLKVIIKNVRLDAITERELLVLKLNNKNSACLMPVNLCHYRLSEYFVSE